jgi:hypothetical protein
MISDFSGGKMNTDFGRRLAGLFPAVKRSVLQVTAILLLVAFATGSLWAQGGTRGAISGTVEDATGALIPGVKVEIVNAGTGSTERTVDSGQDGSFVAALLPVGPYRLVATKEGFAKLEATGVVVRVTETTNVRLKMKVGAKGEEITITEASVPVKLANAATGQVLGADVLSTIPLATRNFFNLLALSAGANSEMADTAALGRGAVSMNVNGQRPVNNNYSLEGINANDINLPILDNVALPNPDAVQEFKTQTSLYDASQGRNGGANIQVALKSGTKNYHGGAYYFLRNTVLNANDWFLKRDQLANGDSNINPDYRQHKFGASVGGPVPEIHGLFFYGNYEGTRALSGAAGGTAFTTLIPALPTDRSAANLTAVFFPSGLGAGGVIDPIALNWLNLPASLCPNLGDPTFCIPSVNPANAGLIDPLLPLDGPNLESLSRSVPGTFTENQFTVSIDKEVGTKDKINGRWFFSNFALVQPFGSTGSTLPFGRNTPQTNRFLKLGWTHILNNKMVNEAYFGFNRFTFAFAPEEPISLTDIGATRPNSAEFPGAYRISIAGSFSLAPGVNDNRGGHFNTFVYGDNFSWQMGKHLFRFGFEASRYQLNRFNNFATRGSVSYADSSDVLTGDHDAFQNFLLGRINTTQGRSGFSSFYFRATDLATYVQDDWKVNRRLTLNLGLRWEGLAIANEKFNFLSNFAGLGDGTNNGLTIIHPSATPNVGTPGVSNCTMLNCRDMNNFAPRLGFALDLLGDQKTVLRGGYGIYYQRTSNQPLLQTSGGPPFSQDFSAAPCPDCPGVVPPGAVTPDNPFPGARPTSDFPLPTDLVIPHLTGFNLALNSFCTGAAGAPCFSSAIDSGFRFFPRRDFHAPYAQQWNLSIQRELFKNWVVEVAYVGTRGVDLIGTGRPLNPSQICTLLDPCAIPPSRAVGVVVAPGTPFVTQQADGTILITGSTNTNKNARVPVQFLGSANSRYFFQEQVGQSTYHSLQTSVVHQFSKGLYFQAAYTYSKSIDNSSGSAFGDELNGLFAWGDLFAKRGLQRGNSDFDRTHRLVISYNYELPFAKWANVENHGLGKIVNGWSMVGATTFQSGTPFMIFDGSRRNIQDPDGVNFTNTANLAAGATLGDVLTTGNIIDRVNGTAGASCDPITGNNCFGFVDTSVFVTNCVNDQYVAVACASGVRAAIGTLGRNIFRGPGQQNWDVSLIKTTKLTERVSVDFRAEFFNLWNHPAFASPQAAGGSLGNYGIVDTSSSSTIINTVNDPRTIQFGLKINF